jgi:hypothetical protein
VYHKLKFVWYWEYDEDKTAEVFETFGKMMALREKGSTDLPKMIYGPFHHIGVSKGFTVFETDDPEKLIYMADNWLPLLRGSFVPIDESLKFVEVWKKVKK